MWRISSRTSKVCEISTIFKEVCIVIRLKIIYFLLFFHPLWDNNGMFWGFVLFCFYFIVEGEEISEKKNLQKDGRPKWQVKSMLLSKCSEIFLGVFHFSGEAVVCLHLSLKWVCLLHFGFLFSVLLKMNKIQWLCSSVKVLMVFVQRVQRPGFICGAG